MTWLASLLAAVGSTLGSAERVKHAVDPPMQPALASWYDDYYGETASGRRYRMGFASLLFGSRWGYRVDFCYRGRCVVGRLDDHGPYVAGRQFDLSSRLRAALACPDLCYLQWRAVP